MSSFPVICVVLMQSISHSGAPVKGELVGLLFSSFRPVVWRVLSPLVGNHGPAIFLPRSVT